jgi:predicted nucleotidyltransferase
MVLFWMMDRIDTDESHHVFDILFKMLSQQQIDIIIQELVAKPNVQGVLLTGSYVYGHPTEESDLDVRIITSDGSDLDDRKWMKFGTRIEAFYNSPERVREYFSYAIDSGDEAVINFWRKGKIVYDPNGVVSELIKEAAEIWEKGPKNGGWKTRQSYKEKMDKRNLKLA